MWTKLTYAYIKFLYNKPQDRTNAGFIIEIPNTIVLRPGLTFL